MKLTKVYPRDIIAIVTLIACFILMALGINHIVTGIIVMVVTFYFARRLDGEGEPDKDLNQKVKKLEDGIKQISKAPNLLPETIPPSSTKSEPLTTGDFKVMKNKPTQ